MDEQAQSVAPSYDPPRGMYNGKLDDKNRLKVPAQIQDFLDQFPDKRFFVTSTDRMTAQIYPIAIWRENEAKLTSGEIPAKIAKAVLFTANDLGQDTTMDTQGRITFNSELCEALGMKGQALRLYSELGHIQILTNEIYQAQKRESQGNAVANREQAEGYGLK